jgi:Cu/Ag efflux protein CusF
MKTSMVVKSIAALVIGAAFPLGAMAAQPSKMMTERGVIEKVDTGTKEFALKGGPLKRTAIFDWNASTRFVENGKPAAASELKSGERATVNYVRHGKQRLASRIAISPNGKTAQAQKVHPRKAVGHA